MFELNSWFWYTKEIKEYKLYEVLVKFNVLNYVLRVLTEFPSKDDSLAISGRTWRNVLSFLICKWKSYCWIPILAK